MHSSDWIEPESLSRSGFVTVTAAVESDIDADLFSVAGLLEVDSYDLRRAYLVEADSMDDLERRCRLVLFLLVRNCLSPGELAPRLSEVLLACTVEVHRLDMAICTAGLSEAWNSQVRRRLVEFLARLGDPENVPHGWRPMDVSDRTWSRLWTDA